MHIKSMVAAALVAAYAAPASAGTLPLDTPLIVDGPITVDAGDVEGYMLRVPENRRVEVRSSKDRVTSIADNIFVSRTLAARARAQGLDKEETVKRRLAQVQDALLADLYMQHVEKSAVVPNLDARARELYISEPAKFTVPEQVHVEHLLIGLNGRTRDMAEARAKEIHAEVTAGKEPFLALAARLSDDPDKKRNGGDLGYSSPNSFVAPVAKRIAGMTRKGEISEPIESHLGFHIVRFVDRTKAFVRPFEDVRPGIIAEEKERLNKRRTEEIVTQIRSTNTVTVHLDKLEALVNRADEVLQRAAAAEAARAAAEAAKPR